jgi:periplasmic protein TonB
MSGILNAKSPTMTNNEIMKASLLDILFEKRNKDYGAYALRRTYNHRLIISIVVSLGLVSCLLFLNSFHKKSEHSIASTVKKDSVVIRLIEIPIEKPKEPEAPKEPETVQRPKELKQPLEKISRVKFTNKMIIKPDHKVKITEVPINTDLKNKIISNINTKGEDEIKKEKTTSDTKITGNGTDKDQTVNSGFIPEEKAPEFPGGKDALIHFLKLNLVTPEELQVGEKKTVEIRFKVGTDGLVSDLEILKSGGFSFDKEVIRVCKKMPRWKPAVQNGGNISVSYLLPVTFIGVEQ